MVASRFDKVGHGGSRDEVREMLWQAAKEALHPTDLHTLGDMTRRFRDASTGPVVRKMLARARPASLSPADACGFTVAVLGSVLHQCPPEVRSLLLMALCNLGQELAALHDEGAPSGREDA